VRDNLEQRFRMRLRNRIDNVVRPGHQPHAHSRFREIHHGEADRQRGGRGDLEVNDRLESHAPNLFQAPRARDSDHDGRENKWCDDRFDQAEKNVAQKVNRVSPIRAQPADESADDQPNEDLDR